MTVLVIGGGDTLRDIRESKNEPFENGVWIGTVPPEWALYLVANASNYFLSCGLSSLIEMGLYGRNGFGLPSQNYSQHCQIKKFRDLYKNWESFDYYDYNKEFVVPDFIPEKDGVRIVQQSFIDFVENENAKDYFQQKVEAYLEKSEKAIQISEELHMNCRDGAQEIADILYKDLFKDNYRKIIFAENKNGDTSLFRALYKNSVEEFVQSIEGDCNIAPPRLLEKGLENGNNNVWLLDKQTKDIPNSINVVTGGPCICYCEGDQNRLSLQDLIDIISPILAAKTWDSKLVFVLTTYEASMQIESDSGLICNNKYLELSRKVKNFIYDFANKINFDKDKIYFVDTGSDKASKILEEESQAYIEYDSLEKLNDLYYFKSIEYGEPPIKEDFFLKVYLRNITMYTPQFISKCIDEDISSLAVVENSTQLKAVIKGFKLSRHKGFKGFLGHFAYLATPGITGIEMARSEPNKCIFLGDTLEEIQTKLKTKMRTCIKNYYESFWPKDMKENFFGYEDDISKQIWNFFNMVKDSMSK